MSYNIGLNVVEVNGTGAPAIAGAATSVAGFNIITRRGIPARSCRSRNSRTRWTKDMLSDWPSP